MTNNTPFWLHMDSADDPDKLAYDLLVRQFPLRPIRSREENTAAMRIADELLNRRAELTSAEKDYLEVLGDLINKYESSEFIDDDTDLEPHEIIKSIIEGQGLKQSDLAKELRVAPSRLSEFLSGKRRASRSLALKLCERFSLSFENLFTDKEDQNEDESFEYVLEPNYKLAAEFEMQTKVLNILNSKIDSLSSMHAQVGELNEKIGTMSRTVDVLLGVVHGLVVEKNDNAILDLSNELCQ